MASMAAARKKLNLDNMDFILNLASWILIYSILTVSMNFLIGYLGILYLAHPAIYGIGAYTYAILTTSHDWSFLSATLAAGFVSMLAAFILSLPAMKLRSHFVGMATLGFLFVTNGIFYNWRSVTRGGLGIPGIPRPEIFGISMNTNLSFFLMTLVISFLCCFIMYRILHSPWSKAVETIREDETAAQTVGKNSYKTKIQAFLICGFFGGIGGALMASYIGFINPASFAIQELIVIIAGVIIGGLASFWGSIIGAIFIVLAPGLLRFLDLPPEILGSLRHGIYGMILILFMLFKPTGILGKRTNVFSK
jgi:branched-chain amino acid transport system permease protein